MAPVMTHIVRVDRRKNFTSSSLPADLTECLEGAFRRVPWWRDRWADRGFRSTALGIARDFGCGLVIFGPGRMFEVPPAFDRFFEPIELFGGLGSNTAALKTISGDKPTREESLGRYSLAILALLAICGAVLFLIGYLRGFPARAALPVLLVFAIIPVVFFGVRALRGIGGRWFLVPGGIAIFRRPLRSGRPPRITLLTPANSFLMFRYISNGKTVMLVMEVSTLAGLRLRRTVSEREGMSVVASWRSNVTPPADEQLEELIGY